METKKLKQLKRKRGNLPAMTYSDFYPLKYCFPVRGYIPNREKKKPFVDDWPF